LENSLWRPVQRQPPASAWRDDDFATGVAVSGFGDMMALDESHDLLFMAQQTDPNMPVMRSAVLWLAAGIGLASVLVLLFPAHALWTLIVSLLLFGLALFMGPQVRDVNDPVAAVKTDAALGLPVVAREVFERLPDPLMLVDVAGRVIFANRAMTAVAGTDSQNKPVSAVLRTPAVWQAVERTAETGEPATIEFSFHVPVERHFEAYIARTEQAPKLTAVLLHDVTSAKRAEEARADFIANASHELRTPLAAVSGFIDTLKGHAKDDERARERFLDIMSVEAGRMRRLIDDLLSLTRIELNEHVPPSGEVDIVEVARDAAAALQGLAQLDDVTIVVADTPNLPPVVGERDELIQLFQNLMHNAIKYGRVGGHVWVDFAVAPGATYVAGRRGPSTMVNITVRDDGEGIPREAVPRLTERFYRVDIKRSRERGGTGLGLAIVKHIVNRHQGSLKIDSKMGEGSIFSILLPTIAAAEPKAPQAIPAAVSNGVTEVI
jgi:two-component system, OmpR family, phosphate regulon sensor histidine kinase PhoR